jgi:hypothetical protein
MSKSKVKNKKTVIIDYDSDEENNYENKIIVEYILKDADISKISTEFRNEKSYNNYSLDILKSALQKYIRRGEIDKAIYFAIEVSLFIFKENDLNRKRIITNFIHRLQIIFLEDVGLSCYNIIPYIDKLFDKLFLRDENSFLIIFLNLVYTMCKNKHTRVCSHYHNLFNMYRDNQKDLEEYLKYFPSIKKYFYLVKKNKSQFRNYEQSIEKKTIDIGFWAKNMTILDENKLKMSNIKKIFEPLLKEEITNIEIMMKWTKELSALNESFLPYYTSIIYYLFKKDIKQTGQIYYLKEDQILDYIKINLREKFVLDDYVIDMHTYEGKILEKNTENFIYEGSLVENELYINKITEEWKNFYNFSKLLCKEGIIDENFLPEDLNKKEIDIKSNFEFNRESEIFELVTRAQLVTSKYKQDTYYAIDKRDNKTKFVKGPYLTTEKIELIKNITEIRKLLNLNYVNFEILELIPDLLDSPLSSRNNIENNKKYHFIVYDNLITDNLITKKHSSKLWPITEVLDFDKMEKYKFTIVRNKNQTILRQYVIQLMFRAIVGLGDLADRNFLPIDDKLYSLDEESLNDDLNILKELKKEKSEIVVRIIDSYKTEFKNILICWKNILENTFYKEDNISESLKNIIKRCLDRIDNNKFIELIL